jgi:mannose-6-phosphate isomerase-like protein (cupin superfamily)
MVTQSKNPNPTTVDPASLPEIKREDAYRDWQEKEGVKVITDFAFEDLDQIELGDWPRKGGKGAVINIPFEPLPNDAHVVELRPGGQSEPEHHLYEEMVYIVSGRGATTVWIDQQHKQTFEWGKGSLFAIPLNATYQFFNGSGTEPARYLSVTNAPPMMRLFHNYDFTFNNPFSFSDRFGGEEGYFSGDGTLYKRRVWETNFVADAINMPLYEWKERGGGGRNVMFELTQNTTAAHISEFQVGTYKKAHRHGPGAHLVILSGDGFSMLWQEGQEPRMAPWKVGGMVIVPTDACFHQHFNAGATPARYLALRDGSQRYGASRTYGSSGVSGADVSVKQGGWQIEYEDEDHEIHRVFEGELKKHDATCRMKGYIPWCTGEVGPTLRNSNWD